MMMMNMNRYVLIWICGCKNRMQVDHSSMMLGLVWKKKMMMTTASPPAITSITIIFTKLNF